MDPVIKGIREGSKIPVLRSKLKKKPQQNKKTWKSWIPIRKKQRPFHCSDNKSPSVKVGSDANESIVVQRPVKKYFDERRPAKKRGGEHPISPQDFVPAPPPRPRKDGYVSAKSKTTYNLSSGYGLTRHDTRPRSGRVSQLEIVEIETTRSAAIGVDFKYQRRCKYDPKKPARPRGNRFLYRQQNNIQENTINKDKTHGPKEIIRFRGRRFSGRQRDTENDEYDPRKISRPRGKCMSLHESKDDQRISVTDSHSPRTLIKLRGRVFTGHQRDTRKDDYDPRKPALPRGKRFQHHQQVIEREAPKNARNRGCNPAGTTEEYGNSSFLPPIQHGREYFPPRPPSSRLDRTSAPIQNVEKKGFLPQIQMFMESSPTILKRGHRRFKAATDFKLPSLCNLETDAKRTEYLCDRDYDGSHLRLPSYTALPHLPRPPPTKRFARPREYNDLMESYVTESKGDSELLQESSYAERASPELPQESSDVEPPSPEFLQESSDVEPPSPEVLQESSDVEPPSPEVLQEAKQPVKKKNNKPQAWFFDFNGDANETNKEGEYDHTKESNHEMPQAWFFDFNDSIDKTAQEQEYKPAKLPTAWIIEMGNSDKNDDMVRKKRAEQIKAKLDSRRDYILTPTDIEKIKASNKSSSLMKSDIACDGFDGASKTGKRHLSHSNDLRNNGNNEEEHEEEVEEEEEEEEKEEDATYNIDCYKEKYNRDDEDDGSDGCAEAKPEQQDSGYISSQGTGSVRCIDRNHGSKYDSSAGNVNGYQNNSDMQKVHSHMAIANGHFVNRTSGYQKNSAGNVNGYQNNNDMQEVHNHMANENGLVENRASGDFQKNSAVNVNGYQNNSDIQEVYNHMANENGLVENRASGDYQKNSAVNVSGCQNKSETENVHIHMANAKRCCDKKQNKEESTVLANEKIADKSSIQEMQQDKESYKNGNDSGNQDNCHQLENGCNECFVDKNNQRDDTRRERYGYFKHYINTELTGKGNLCIIKCIEWMCNKENKIKCEENGNIGNIQNVLDHQIEKKRKFSDNCRNYDISCSSQYLNGSKEQSSFITEDDGSGCNHMASKQDYHSYLSSYRNEKDEEAVTRNLTWKDIMRGQNTTETNGKQEEYDKEEIENDNEGVDCNINNNNEKNYRGEDNERSVCEDSRKIQYDDARNTIYNSKEKKCLDEGNRGSVCGDSITIQYDDTQNTMDNSNEKKHRDEDNRESVCEDSRTIQYDDTQNTVDNNNETKHRDEDNRDSVCEDSRKIQYGDARNTIDNNNETKQRGEDNGGSVYEDNRTIQSDDARNTIGNNNGKKCPDGDNRGSVCEDSRTIQYGDARNTICNNNEKKHHDEDNRRSVCEDSRTIQYGDAQDIIDNNNETKHRDEDNRDSVCEDSRTIQYGDARNTICNNNEKKHPDEDNRGSVCEDNRTIQYDDAQNTIDNNNGEKCPDGDNRGSVCEDNRTIQYDDAQNTIDNNNGKKCPDGDNRGSVCEDSRKIQYGDARNTTDNNKEKKHRDEDNGGSVCEDSRKIQYGDARNTTDNNKEKKHRDEDNRESVCEDSKKMQYADARNTIDNSNEKKHRDEDNRGSVCDDTRKIHYNDARNTIDNNNGKKCPDEDNRGSVCEDSGKVEYDDDRNTVNNTNEKKCPDKDNRGSVCEDSGKVEYDDARNTIDNNKEKEHRDEDNRESVCEDSKKMQYADARNTIDNSNEKKHRDEDNRGSVCDDTRKIHYNDAPNSIDNNRDRKHRNEDNRESVCEDSKTGQYDAQNSCTAYNGNCRNTKSNLCHQNSYSNFDCKVDQNEHSMEEDNEIHLRVHVDTIGYQKGNATKHKKTVRFAITETLTTDSIVLGALRQNLTKENERRVFNRRYAKFFQELREKEEGEENVDRN